MDQNTAIKAMEEYSASRKLKLTTIGQMAVGNRNAYERLKAGTAHVATAERIVAWIDAERAAAGEGGEVGHA